MDRCEVGGKDVECIIYSWEGQWCCESGDEHSVLLRSRLCSFWSNTVF